MINPVFEPFSNLIDIPFEEEVNNSSKYLTYWFAKRRIKRLSKLCHYRSRDLSLSERRYSDVRKKLIKYSSRRKRVRTL